MLDLCWSLKTRLLTNVLTDWLDCSWEKMIRYFFTIWSTTPSHQKPNPTLHNTYACANYTTTLPIYISFVHISHLFFVKVSYPHPELEYTTLPFTLPRFYNTNLQCGTTVAGRAKNALQLVARGIYTLKYMRTVEMVLQSGPLIPQEVGLCLMLQSLWLGMLNWMIPQWGLNYLKWFLVSQVRVELEICPLLKACCSLIYLFSSPTVSVCPSIWVAFLILHEEVWGGISRLPEF